MPERSITRTALVLALLAAPAVTWWAVGDLSEPLGSDHFVRTPGWLESNGTMIGRSALAIGAAGLVWLLSPIGRRGLERQTVLGALPLVALGVFVGFTYRVFTAATIGANIGAGLLLLFGVGFVPAMLALAAVLGRRPTQPTQGGDNT